MKDQIITQVKARFPELALLIADAGECTEFYTASNPFMVLRIWNDRTYSVLTRTDDDGPGIEQDFNEFEHAARCFEYTYKVTAAITAQVKRIFCF